MTMNGTLMKPNARASAIVASPKSSMKGERSS